MQKNGKIYWNHEINLVKIKKPLSPEGPGGLSSSQLSG
jgi:hypothetical protein